MHIRRISVAKYPYPYPFKQGNYYPYPIRIHENCGMRISAKYLSADTYPRISGRGGGELAVASQLPHPALGLSGLKPPRSAFSISNSLKIG